MIILVLVYMLSWATAVDESIELAENVNLVAMDSHLTKLLTHPQPGQGAKLLNDSELFCAYLDKVLDLVDEKNPKGTQYFKQFAQAGGVKFVNTTYSPEKVKKTYKYSEHDFEGLEGTIREIRSIWKCIGVLLNVTLPDSGEHFFEKVAAAVRAQQLARGEKEANETVAPVSSDISEEIDWF